MSLVLLTTSLFQSERRLLIWHRQWLLTSAVQELQCDIHINLPACADRLQALGHNVAISHSAGRYLCNYIYFRSLQLCSNVPNWHALFVHVPPLEVIGQDKEMAFAVDLFALLAQKVQAIVPAGGLTIGRKGTLEPSTA